jgi:3-deoxy-D-manno-octulosonate 8-phosphate phosphatase KdsC-like HAD superfamily phosphatase
MVGFINDSKIRYYTRIRENFKGYNPRDGHTIKVLGYLIS